MTALAAALVAGMLSALAGVLLRRVPAVAGAGTAVTGALGVAAGAGALAGPGWRIGMPWLLPISGVTIAVDALGGVFMTVSGAVAVVAGIYSIGYSRAAQPALPIFVVALLLVPAAGSVGAFLACWELMAIASLLLLLTEHRQRAEVASAVRWYAVMTHAGFVAILIGLLVLVVPAADDTFAAIRATAPSPLTAGAAFVLCLAGFSSKAGIVPLHAWLPRAHPEAPSHVSALMSAAMVTMGVYGIVRVGFDLLGGGERWWWLTVLVAGAISAVYGILQAVVSTDLKRLLGHSTTENMGLVLIGVGASGLFATGGSPVLAALALTAALLHVVAHAAFKTLLFLAAGSVLHATGTRDLDALGGLRGAMPATTLAFGVGALAASALPPGTAFVSEWLLLQSLTHGLPTVLAVAVAAVALSAGLAVATFVKAFGVGFLARPRGEGAASAGESGPAMLSAMALAGVACVVLALAPTLVLPALGRVAGNLTGSSPAVHGVVALELVGIAGSLSPLLFATALLVAFALVVAVPRLFVAQRARRAARLWDCGGGPMTPRMEYTATAFAEPLQRVFDNVLRPVQDVDVTHVRESRYLVQAVEYRRRVPDRVERRLYEPLLAAVAAWGRAGSRLATGSVHLYLGYGFYTVCVVLLALVVIR